MSPTKAAIVFSLILLTGLTTLTSQYDASLGDADQSGETRHRWEQPLTILYTADTNGFLQSCGCSAGQVGGLAKRATLIKRLQSADNLTLFVDGGNLASDSRRAEAVLDSLKLIRCEALAPGPLDEALGKAFTERAARRGIPLLGWPANGENRQTSHVTAHALVASLPDLALAQLTAGLQPIFRRKNREQRLLIALSHLDASRERQLLEHPDVQGKLDLVIGRRDSSERTMTVIGGTHVVPVTIKGEVGIVTVSDAGNREWTHRFAKVTDDLPADAQVQEAVSVYYQRQAQKLLEASLTPSVDWRDVGYEPAARCADCHAEQLARWRESKHARAATVLRDKERLVGECLSCHSELYRRTNKFNPKLEQAWHGVDCASCHGDGIVHSALGTRDYITRKVDEKTCRSCHNPENDPHFDYPKYLEKIRHW